MQSLFFKKKKVKEILLSHPSVHPPVLLSVMLPPPKPLDEIQPNLVCKLLTWMGRAAAIIFALPPGALGRGQKVKIPFNINYKVNFKDFYAKLCMCSHKWKIQNISDGIFILSPESCPRGAQGVIFFFKHGHVAYQIDRDKKQNRMQIKFPFKRTKSSKQ